MCAERGQTKCQNGTMDNYCQDAAMPSTVQALYNTPFKSNDTQECTVANLMREKVGESKEVCQEGHHCGGHRDCLIDS